MNEVISVRGLARKFGATVALAGVSFSLPSRGLIGIVGPSGCGKSTLLNILAGLDDGYEGSVRILGKKMERMKDATRRRFRLQNVGYVFQNFNLLELETAEMNVRLVLDAVFVASDEDKRRKAMDLLAFFGMEQKGKQQVNTLSGGEKQRVALARALAADPKIVLCDEPTGALDERRAEEVFAFLRKVAVDHLVLVVTHDRPLASRHCDVILRMHDGLLDGVDHLCHPPASSSPRSFYLPKRQSHPRLRDMTLFVHAFHVLKAKKGRTLLAQGAIALGLSGLGLSFYISNSISDELNAAFSSLVPPNVIVMTPRNGADSPLGSVYGASFDECIYACEEYADMVADYGSDLHMDYESWFVDRNDFTFQSGVETIRLPEFSIRHINDFKWIDQEPSLVFYPRPPAVLQVDQIVLGLPYATMFQTCLGLHILRNYQSLGEYIDAHGLELVLHIANYEYGFEDEELFQVAAVTEASYPCIYHFDHRWNRKIIVDQLRFRTSITEHTMNPQYVFEIPFLTLNVPSSEFLYFARRDPKLAHLVYENANSSYVPSLCPVGGSCEVNRLYLYGADKSGVGFETLDEAAKICPEIVGRQPVTVGSYYADVGTLAMGFRGKFFLCKDERVADAVVDSYSDLPLEAAFLPAEEIEGSRDGSYLSGALTGVRISSERVVPASGNVPASVDECVLSTALYERWGKPKEIYVAAEIGSEEVGARYERSFGVRPLQVTGHVDADHDTFYVVDDWSVDFYLQELGMSSFYLEPYGAVFSLDKNADASAVVDKLEKIYGDYSFSNPASEIASSISATLRYVGTILTAFSFIALLMSALLFLIVMAITVSECRNEERLFSVLGISKRDIIRSYHAHCLFYAFGSTLSSLVMMLGAEILAKYYIASSFHASVSFGIPWSPLLIVVLAGLGFTFFIMLGISFNLRIKMSKK